MTLLRGFPLILLACVSLTSARADELPTPLRVPVSVAYVEPNPDAVTFSPTDGVSGWTDKNARLVWYGELKAAGRLHAALDLRLPTATAMTRLRLTVGRVSHMTQADHSRSSEAAVRLDFDDFSIPRPGFYRFVLSGVARAGDSFGAPDALLLSGPAAVGAHFIHSPVQRGAASVHLSYPTPPDAPISAFYNEVTAQTDPIASYYMACGFRRGYFGIQVNSPTERRIIFSVWDSGNEAKDRNKVAAADQVQLVSKGPDVFADSFGNEGTGGHSHLVYPWKTGKTYRFLVTARPDGEQTIYSGYFWFPEQKKWGLIAAFRAPGDDGWLRGLYSFDEDFWSGNGQRERRAAFGPAWFQTTDGAWTELTTARFTHTGKDERTDFSAVADRTRWVLASGGYRAHRPIRYGDTVTRPASGKPPTGEFPRP